MRSFLLLVVFASLTLAQTPCCFPKQFTLESKEFLSPEYETYVLAVYDGINNKLYENFYDVNLDQWSVFYLPNGTYIYENNSCTLYPPNPPGLLCLMDNDTYISTITIAGVEVTVWATITNSGTLYTAVTNDDCAPVAEEFDESEGEFSEFQLFYNVVFNANRFPNLPSQCLKNPRRGSYEDAKLSKLLSKSTVLTYMDVMTHRGIY